MGRYVGKNDQVPKLTLITFDITTQLVNYTGRTGRQAILSDRDDTIEGGKNEGGKRL